METATDVLKAWNARILVGVGLSIALLVAVPQRVQAAPVTLDTLLAGASLTVGDLVFDQFSSYSSVATGGASAVNPANVTVDALEVDPLRARLFYESTAFVTNVGEFQQTVFSFRVTTTGDLITDNHLGLVGAFSGSAGAQNTITEQVTDATGNVLGDKLVTFGAAGDQLSDDLVFAPQSVILVTTTITLSEFASLTPFQQDFTQTAVPEPVSITLLGLGLAGLGARRWRQCRNG